MKVHQTFWEVSVKEFKRLSLLPLLGLSIALGVWQMVAGQEPPEVEEAVFSDGDAGNSHGKRQERFLYAATIAQSASDPDFITVIGADPRDPTLAKS